MKEENSISWLNNTETILRFIQRLINELDELQEQVLPLKQDEVLFSQGDPLQHLYLILEGEVRLTRTQADGSELTLINLEPGNFIGLIAFTTGEPTLTTATITKTGLALKMRPQQFEQYLSDHPRLKHPLQQLMLNNMIQRYQGNIRLHTKTHLLNRELNKERNDLKEAYRQLEETHQMLVHHEKMATLGELVAGFAHEVNNPASALMRSAENLIELYSSFEDSDEAYKLFKMGLKSQPLDSPELRRRMLKMEREFPFIHNRASIRKLAHMPDEGLEILNSLRKKTNLETLVDHFEAGKMIHNIHIASKRIANLVKSLKSYSRQDRNEEELVDLREGIQDTLLVLSNRLKFIDLNLDLQDIPQTCVQVADMNQVWTNIIVNACDALDGSGVITIATRKKDQLILVEISDNGPGIQEDILPRIFEPNFTTKNQGAKFGLGLGLAISNEIIRKNGGSINVINQPEGGAKFTIEIPIHDDC